MQQLCYRESMTKNLNKEREPATKPGELILMDLSTIKYLSEGGKMHWVLFVDDYTKYKWSLFIKNKSDLATEGIQMIKRIQNDFQLKIKRIRCDNVGENMALQGNVIREQLGIKF